MTSERAEKPPTCERRSIAMRTSDHALMALAVTALLVPRATLAAESGPPRPNVIVILADDMGYGDLSAVNGGLSRTPALDQLMSESVRWRYHPLNRGFDDVERERATIDDAW